MLRYQAPSWQAIAARASKPLLVLIVCGRLDREPWEPQTSQGALNGGRGCCSWPYSSTSHMWTSCESLDEVLCEDEDDLDEIDALFVDDVLDALEAPDDLDLSLK